MKNYLTTEELVEFHRDGLIPHLWVETYLARTKVNPIHDAESALQDFEDWKQRLLFFALGSIALCLVVLYVYTLPYGGAGIVGYLDKFGIVVFLSPFAVIALMAATLIFGSSPKPHPHEAAFRGIIMSAAGYVQLEPSECIYSPEQFVAKVAKFMATIRGGCVLTEAERKTARETFAALGFSLT